MNSPETELQNELEEVLASLLLLAELESLSS